VTLEEGLPPVKQAWKSINCQGVFMTNWKRLILEVCGDWQSGLE